MDRRAPSWQFQRRSLARIALVLASATVLGTAGVGAWAYEGSRRALFEHLGETSELLASSVRAHAELLVRGGTAPEEALRRAWDATKGDDRGLYLCFIGADGKLDLNTRHADRTGASVVEMRASAPYDAPARVRDLLREKRSWSGENVDLAGVQQIVSFSYSPQLDGLVTVHVPQAAIRERVVLSLLPWIYGMAVVTLILLPAAFLVIGVAYRRSESALAGAMTEREDLGRRLAESQRLEAVGRLAGGIAHDFNNMLMVVFSGVDALRRQSLPPGSDEEVRQIEGAAERGSALVKQLLAFSARKPHGEREVVDVGALVLGLEPLVRRLAGEQVTLDVNVADGLPATSANIGQIEQVLTNLVVNARDASEPGTTVRVRVFRPALPLPTPHAGSVPEAGDWVAISVADAGTGMAPEILAHALEPFFTTKGPGGGSGLGLATAYGILQQHGGHLAIRSELGTGTEVHVYLPASARTVAAPRANSHERVPDSFRRARVLVVDDEADVRESLTRLLSRHGYAVEGVGSASAARARLADQPFDVVVADVVMPVEGGESLARELLVRAPTLRMVLMSGYEASDRARKLQDPRLAFLAKPFKAEALHAEIQRLCSDGAASS